MRIYHDWEFLEDGRKIFPISVGMTAEDGRYYYAIFDDLSILNEAYRDVWLRDNVLKHLPLNLSHIIWDTEHSEYLAVKSANKIKKEIEEFIISTPSPELWADYGAYDHICYAQLFGRMVDLPTGFPQHTNDLQTEFHRLGKPRLPLQNQDTVHHAGYDSKYDKIIGDYLMIIDRT